MRLLTGLRGGSHPGGSDAVGMEDNRKPCSLARRHQIVAMCALCAFVCYCDRVIISVAIVPMARELQWPLRVQGNVLGAFFYGYVLSQLLGAHLARKFGGKSVLNMAVVGWSLLTVATPFVAHISLSALLACRVLLGLSEGMAFPVMYHLMSGWVPEMERSRSVVLLSVGTYCGTVLAFIVSPGMVASYGWESVFYVFGWGGFIWCAIWRVYGADATPPQPNAHFDFSQLGRLLRPDAALYSIYACHFSWNICLYISVMWLPTYLQRRFGAKPSDGWLASLPYVVLVPASWGWSWLVDAAIRAGRDPVAVRRAASATGFLGGALLLVAYTRASTEFNAILSLCAALAVGSLSLSGWEAAKLSAVPKEQAGLLQGVSNTIGNFSGAVGVPLASILREWYGSWDAVWYLCAVVWVGAAAAATMSPRTTGEALASPLVARRKCGARTFDCTGGARADSLGSA